MGKTKALPALFSLVKYSIGATILLLAAAVSAAAQGVGTSIPTKTWTMVPTNGFPEQAEGFGKLVYAPGLRKSVMLENYHEIGSEPDSALVGYDFTANRWDVLSLGGNFHTENMPDSGHSSGMFTYNSNNNTFLYYCCHSGSNEPERPLHVWWYDSFGQIGLDKQTPTKPGPNQQGTAAFDVAHNTYVYYDGASSYTWTYSPVTNVWQKKSPTGTPPPTSTQYFPNMEYDSSNQEVYYFGGGGNDIYTYDIPSNTWHLVNVTGTKPSARYASSFAYDSTNNIFMVFGGTDMATGTVLSDTWVYDPVSGIWSQLSPNQSPPAFQYYSYLAYDSDDNVFVLVTSGSGGYTNSTWSNYAAQTWLFRYAGSGPNAGTANPSYTPSSGSINKHSDAWANEPTLASNGSTLYSGWIETGEPSDTSVAAYPHVYASQLSGSTWNALGSSFSSIDSDIGGGTLLENHAPSIAMVGAAPWISWYNPFNGSVYAKNWNLSAWVGGPVGRGTVNNTDVIFQGRSQIIGIGSTPYIAFLENNHTSCYPWCSQLYVKQFSGSSWTGVGTSFLNRGGGSSGDLADSVSLTSDGTNPIVAWTEYTTTGYYAADSNPQLYVSKWNGSSWVILAGSLNVDSVNGWAYDANITYMNGQPYVAWTERTQTGNNQLYVKTWNGSFWTLVGSGALNRNGSAGWAYRPSVTTDGTNLYVGWVEQSALGQRPQTYVSEWNGSSWSSVGGSLNADTFNGSAERVSLAILNSQPVAAWGEVNPGTLRQIFVKQWNGSAWISASGSINPPPVQPPTVPTNFTATAISQSQINLSWTASTDNIGVSGYKIYRGGTLLGTSASTSYSDAHLAASTSYSYTVSAYDSAANNSAQSAPATATTQSSTPPPPSPPAGYNTGHPRLPYPDTTYLLGLAGNATELAKYNSAASNFDPNNPAAGGVTAVPQFRRVLIAYLVNKAIGNTAVATADLNKIKQLANLDGVWGPLIASANDGSDSGGGTTVTSTSLNFQTACNGGSCVNYFIAVERDWGIITNVVNANTVTVRYYYNTLSAQTTALRIRLLSSTQAQYIAVEIAMAYDWTYNDLDADTRAQFMEQLEVQASMWEQDWVNIGASPYNDVFYNRDNPGGVIAALAIYPDFDSADPAGGTCPTKPCGTYHFNYMSDKVLNDFLPVWHHVFGDHGGGWHESWPDYQNSSQGVGMTRWIVPMLLSWQSATGQPIFTQNPWLKNYPYYTMYMYRPDGLLEQIADGDSTHWLTSEYNINGDYGVGLGSLNGLAEIYNDPVLRGWARFVNQEFSSGPTGFEPSAWPFYSPDSNNKQASNRSSLPTYRDFDGWGTVFARSGWNSASDTTVTLRYGDNMWSKNMQDAGSFTIFHGGNLAIQSGAYRPGYGSEHERFYGVQSIAHNTLTITDPNDYYPGELFGAYDNNGGVLQVPMPNDGGQRRAGSPYTSFGAFPFPGFYSPDCYTGCTYSWQAMYNYYHMGSMLKFVGTPQYTYAAVDITPAYNNSLSATTPNTSNRTQRVTQVIRNMLYIPPGYVIIYDSVNSTNPNFKKKWLLHSINQPIVTGNKYEIDRTQNAIMQPWNPGTTYQYDGKLVGWMVTPGGGNINVAGGPSKEFWIENPQSPGTGTNWNLCQQGQCSGGYQFLAPATPDIMQPDPKYGGIETGSWRLEESPATPANQDYFLNVMLATDYSNTNVPATVTGTFDANNVGATWSDAQNTYTITFPKSGIGGYLTVTGALKINANLSGSAANACDLNGDGTVNAADVQIAISQVLGTIACGTADLLQNGQCNVVDVQRVINVVLGAGCRVGP